MNTLIYSILAIMVPAAPAFASEGRDSGEFSLFFVTFLAFGALIMLCQLTPGVALFSTMIKELFSRTPKKSSLPSAKWTGKP